MPQISITQLPQAQALTGTESVPVVQGGVTVQTTTGAISGAGALNYPFLTVGSTVGLTQARQIAAGTGLSLTDNGAGSTLQVNLTGAALSLNSSPSGLQVKTGPSTLTSRSIAVGGGMTVSNADGVSGNPTLGLNTNLQNLAALSGTGLVTVNGSAFSQTSILGTSNQITIANGNASVGNPTVAIASNAVLPGTGSVIVPQGTTAQRAAATFGALRYNTDTGSLESYTQAVGWQDISTAASGVNTFSGGSTGLTPNTPTVGGVVLGGIVNPASGGTGVNNNSSTITLGGNILTGGDFTTSGAYAVTLTATNTTSLTLPTTGTLATLAGSETLTNKTISGANNTLTNIGNSSLTNSSVTYNGVTVALGASGTITANTPNALTFNNSGSGDASGTTFDGSAARTISYNTVGASPLAGSTSLTTLGTITTGVWNGTPIGNSYLANSTVTVGTTSIALGGSSLTLGGLTSVAVTQDPVSALQLATKQYVDAVAEGLHVHAACAAATTGTLASITGGTVTYNNGTAGVGATLTLSVALTTLDGYSLQNGDRVLVKNEATQANNGIYTWATGGTVLTRATDFDTTTEVASGDFTFVTNGTLYANTGWVQTNPVTTIGTSPIVFVQFSGAGTYTAGTGLTLTGSQFSLTVPVTAALGGTGQTSYTTGDLLYATSATALSKLGIGTNGQVLTSSGTAPQWTSGSSISVGTATNLAGGTANSLPYQSGVGTTTFLSPGNSGSVLIANGSGLAPSWAASSISNSPSTFVFRGTSGEFGAGVITATGLTNSSLTSGRVVYSTTGGAQTDSANLTFDGSTLSVYGVQVGRGGGANANNTAVGMGALSSNTIGNGNTAYGASALYGNTDGSQNVAVGYAANYKNTSGGANTSVGYFTLGALSVSSTTGGYNTAIGWGALSNLTSATYNISIGYNSGSLITTGSKNVILGSYTGNSGGLDIRTASNYVVLSDGDGNPRAYWDGANATFNGNLTFGSGLITNGINGGAF